MLRLLILLLCLAPGWLSAEDDARKRHPWGRFPVGSWKRVRIHRQTFTDGMLSATSVEESKATLKAADAKQFTLLVETQKKAAGQVFDDKNELSRSYYGSPPGQPVDVKPLDEEGKVELDGQTIKCRLWEVKFETNSLRRISRLHLSDIHDGPLRVDSRTVHPEDGSLVMRTLSEVRERAVLGLVLGEQRQASIVYTLQEKPTSRQATHELHCAEVPGGVVRAWSKKMNTRGQLTERTTLELLDFGVPGDAP